MNNILQKAALAVPSAKTVNQQAGKIYNIQEAKSVMTGNINHTYIFPSAGKMTPQIAGDTVLGQSREYYNLFVMGGEEFPSYSNGSFMVPKDRALTCHTSEDITDEEKSLAPESIQKLQSFPAIFCSENSSHGKADDSQMAVVGYITGISVQDNGIKIDYLSTHPVRQNKLIELSDRLGIEKASERNEFDLTHWCVKRNNLYETLRNAGITI